MTRVGVLVPVYQGAEVIDQAVENILDQTEPPFEIVVADDGSTDGLEARVAALRPACAARGVELIYTGGEHRGRGAARNLAVAAARSEFVAWFDADDLWAPEKLAKQRAAFERLRRDHPEGQLLLTCPYLRYDGARSSGHMARPVPVIGINDVIAIHTRRHIQLQTVFGPRAVFAAIPFDPELNRAEDFDFALRFTAAGGKIVNPEPEDAPPLVHYFRSHANSGREGRISNRAVVARNAALFAANHIDAKAFLEHKLTIGLGGADTPSELCYVLAPGPALTAVADDPFGAARPRVTRGADGVVTLRLPRRGEADCAAVASDGTEIARSRFGDALEIPRRTLVGWFMAGARWLVISPARGHPYPAERLIIARAPSGLISVAAPGSGREP